MPAANLRGQGLQAHPRQRYSRNHIARVGFPKLIWYGTQGEFNVLVMELLGPNIESLLKCCGKRFSLTTTVMLGQQMIDLMESLHGKSFIHRDIKPDNFVIGIGEGAGLVHMIDFGLAKRYRDPRSKIHIQYRDNKNLTGTARYASINTHIGLEQARRDDIESWAYVLIYMMRGSLPWQGIHGCPKKERYDRILELKMSTPVELLCKRLPRTKRRNRTDVDEFAVILYYARAIPFEEKPDYLYLRNCLMKALTENVPDYEPVFDWLLPEVSPRAFLSNVGQAGIRRPRLRQQPFRGSQREVRNRGGEGHGLRLDF